MTPCISYYAGDWIVIFHETYCRVDSSQRTDLEPVLLPCCQYVETNSSGRESLSTLTFWTCLIYKTRAESDVSLLAVLAWHWAAVSNSPCVTNSVYARLCESAIVTLCDLQEGILPDYVTVTDLHHRKRLSVSSDQTKEDRWGQTTSLVLLSIPALEKHRRNVNQNYALVPICGS